MSSRRVIPIVLCGGSGSRLWPRSRKMLPKPFVVLPGRERTLIEDTYRRLAAIGETAAVITVTAADHAFLCNDDYHKTTAADSPPHIVIAEPLPRNTAAAIAVAAAVARQRFGDGALLAVLPADHLIHDDKAFAAALANALTAAESGGVALLGVPPTHAATGYGYMECGSAVPNAAAVFKVRRFVEKPDLATAERFVAEGNFFWNAGMFCFSAAAAMQLLQQHAPDIFSLLPKVLDSTDDVHPKADIYSRFPAVSFDYAVMEKTDAAVVVRAANLGWSDIGSWSAVADCLPAAANNNRTTGDVQLRECADTFVAAADKLIVGVGLKGMHIIDSPDALLIAANTEAENIRAVYEELASANRKEALATTTVRRPWGEYVVLSAGNGYKVKRIEVFPGAQLSLQSHRRRSEHWTTVAGVMQVVINEREFDMAVDESCYIPLGAKHRMSNQGNNNAAVIEVQIGDYLEEDDIIRYEDIYGRVSD